MKKVTLATRDASVLLRPMDYIQKRRVRLEELEPYVIITGIGVEVRGKTEHFCNCEHCDRVYDEITGYYKDMDEAREALCESEVIEQIGECFIIRIVQQDTSEVFA